MKPPVVSISSSSDDEDDDDGNFEEEELESEYSSQDDSNYSEPDDQEYDEEEENDVESDEEECRDNQGSNDLEEQSLNECKAYLRKHGLRLSGTKEECIQRIKEHERLKDGNGESLYPRSSFSINCTGDACKGDIVLFKQKIHNKFDKVANGRNIMWKRTVAGRIVKESYGASKQQHTFTVEVLWNKGSKRLPPLSTLLVKGRNLYRFGTYRQVESELFGHEVDTYSIREPVGVCAGICPFNFPAMTPLWLFPVAVTCGNTFVLKPSEKGPGAFVMLAELAMEAGLPSGVLNIVHATNDIVNAVCHDEDIKAISYVGSNTSNMGFTILDSLKAGLHIYSRASTKGKRVQSNMGAKNHGIVMPDANIDATLNALLAAGFGAAGQRCMALSTVVFVGDATKWENEVVKRAKNLKVNAGIEPE